MIKGTHLKCIPLPRHGRHRSEISLTPQRSAHAQRPRGHGNAAKEAAIFSYCFREGPEPGPGPAKGPLIKQDASGPPPLIAWPSEAKE